MKPVQFEQATRTLGYTVAGRKVPVVRDHLRGETVSCWRLNALERVFALFTGRVWLRVMHLAPPPASMQVRSPFVAPSGAPGKREPISAKQLLRWVKKLGKKAAVVTLAATVGGLTAPMFAACPPGHGPHGRAETTRDGAFTVCLADVTPGKYELWSVVTGGAPGAPVVPVKLSPPIPREHGDVILFEISPDSKSVAFTADARRWTQYDLYVAPIAGGPPKLVSPAALSVDSDVDTFAWSGRSDQLVYRYGRNTNGQWDIFAVKATGGSPVRLNPATGPGRGVEQNFKVPLGRAAFRCDCETDETFKDYLQPLPGTIFGDGLEGGSVGAWR